MNVCVHCMKERGAGCRCVSPFADNAVLAGMRDDLAQESALKSVIAMMQRMTDNMLLFGDRLSDDGQTVPGITEWLPGDRFPRPNMAIVSPKYSDSFQSSDIQVLTSHHVPEDMVYLVEQPAHWIGSRCSGINIQDDDGKRHYPPVDESDGE